MKDIHSWAMPRYFVEVSMEQDLGETKAYGRGVCDSQELP